MKLSEGQKRIAKSYLVYSAGYFVAFPLISWIYKKAFSWESVLIAAVTVVAVGLFGLLLVAGARIPKKDEKEL